jgi:hypothetical protein
MYGRQHGCKRVDGSSYSFFPFDLKNFEFIFLPIMYQELGDGNAPSIERPVIMMAWAVAVI